MSLTPKQIINAKPGDKPYRLADEGGLSIEVSRLKDGTAGLHWRYRYEIGGKGGVYALGSFANPSRDETPEAAELRRKGRAFTLSEARAERDRCKLLVRAGQHPKDARERARTVATAAAGNTFGRVAAEYVSVKLKDRSAKHRQRFSGFIAKWCGAIVDLPIDTVTAADVLRVLQAVEASGKAVMRSHGQAIIGAVFKYGISTLRCKTNPARDVTGAFAAPVSESHQHLTRERFPAFFAALDDEPSLMAALGVRVLLYTFVRTGELRKAKWPDLDLDAAEPVWLIPAANTKKNRDLLVPLAPPVVELFRRLQAFRSPHSDFILPHSQKPREPMAPDTMAEVMKRVAEKVDGPAVTPHGLRATAATILGDAGWDADLIDLQLAHLVGSKTTRAYQRAKKLPERRAMMLAYADLVDQYRQPTSNVIPMRAA